MWHYLDDGLYGSFSNVMTETDGVHPPILALRELFSDPNETCEFERVLPSTSAMS